MFLVFVNLVQQPLGLSCDSERIIDQISAKDKAGYAE